MQTKKLTSKNKPGRPRGSAPVKETIFEYKDWRIERFDSYNIALCKKGESPHKTRYYGTLKAALLGLSKEVGLSHPDLKTAIDVTLDLDSKITKLAL